MNILRLMMVRCRGLPLAGGSGPNIGLSAPNTSRLLFIVTRSMSVHLITGAEIGDCVSYKLM